MKIKLALLGALAVLPGFAAAQTVVIDGTEEWFSDAMTGFATNGAMMDGMRVTVTYWGGGTEIRHWWDTGTDSGAALGTDWSLALDGDTFTAPWELRARGHAELRSVFIEAWTGATVFDLTDPSTGTPGSAQGATFEFLAGTNVPGAVVTATYSGIVGITPVAPVGDLYAMLRIDFANPFGPNSILNFRADTDNATTQVVPEPATMLALGAGLAALAARRRNRKA